MNETIDSFNYTSDSFLDNSTRSALNDFTASNVDSINITGTCTILCFVHVAVSMQCPLANQGPEKQGTYKLFSCHIRERDCVWLL